MLGVDDKREMFAAVAGASMVALEAMRSQLGEAMEIVIREIVSRSASQVALRSAPVEVSVVASTSHKSVSRGSTVKRTCDNHGCGVVYEARQADLRRGWGKCCSKSCAASHKLRCNPSHGYLHGGAERSRMSEDEIRERDHQAAMSDAEMGWDGHKGTF